MLWSPRKNATTYLIAIATGLSLHYLIGWNYGGLLLQTLPAATTTSLPTPSVPTIAIAGTAQNVARSSPQTVATIRRIAREFKLLVVVVYENDSADNTLEMLNSWSEQLDGVKVHVISELNVPGSRTERLARGRNALLSYLLDKSNKDEQPPPTPDYLLMMDLDSVNDDLEGVSTCLQLPTGWGGCCANQRDVYYDLWALRTYDDWVNCDVWFECQGGPPLQERFRSIAQTADPIKVRSCFGGAALYDFRHLINSTTAPYIGTGNHNGRNHDQCEHVSFHESLKAQMYIQPAMVNSAPLQHIPIATWQRLGLYDTIYQQRVKANP